MTLPVSIITPSFERDFESCRLLCDTLDAYVTGFDVHYIVVSAEDRTLFGSLAGSRRHIVDASQLLPVTLLPVPVRWKGRRYCWAPGMTLPVFGWHLQQIRKFAMTMAQPNPRVVFIDSDNFFVRPFDLAGFAGAATVPLQVDRNAVQSSMSHGVWIANARRLLGLSEPTFPTDDFVGQMIVWDTEIVREIVRRIEANSGTSWWKALLKVRDFSEYMIYGAAATDDPSLSSRHHIVEEPPCLSYWEGPALDEAALRALLSQLAPHQSALAIQSFTGTPVALLRAAALPQRAAA